MPSLWDPCFQTSCTSVLLGGTKQLLGRGDPRPLVFLAAGPTPCHPAVLRKPSVLSPADGPSAPTHLTSLATRGLGTFLGTLLEDVARTLCEAASSPRTRNLWELVGPPAAPCPAGQDKHTVRLCRESLLRPHHRCAVSDDRIFHARFHLLQHPGCRAIELSRAAPDIETPLRPGHAVGSLTQIGVTIEHRESSNLFRIDTSWPYSHRLLSDLSSLTNKTSQPTLSLSASDGSPTQSIALP